MLRRCVLTVFSETDSSPAISGRDRFVGRYRSTLSSPGLSSSAGGHEDCSVAAGGEPCRTSRMSVSSAGAAERDVRTGVWGLSGSLQPSLALVELTCSDHRAS